MKKVSLSILIGFFTILISCSEGSQKVESMQVKVVDFAGLQPLLSKQNDTVYVINFWATWCAPCIKEIPYFEGLSEDFSGEKVVVVLVNLDFPNHLETRLIPFLREQNVKSKVLMLDDVNSNYWINEISSEWSGAIPATLIYKGEKRTFYEKEFTYAELHEAVKSFL